MFSQELKVRIEQASWRLHQGRQDTLDHLLSTLATLTGEVMEIAMANDSPTAHQHARSSLESAEYAGVRQLLQNDPEVWATLDTSDADTFLDGLWSIAASFPQHFTSVLAKYIKVTEPIERVKTTGASMEWLIGKIDPVTPWDPATPAPMVPAEPPQNLEAILDLKRVLQQALRILDEENDPDKAIAALDEGNYGNAASVKQLLTTSVHNRALFDKDRPGLKSKLEHFLRLCDEQLPEPLQP
ncbi:MAG TPA: hypothetical protein VFO38_06620 [Candidatus Saccharimonadales bacterium]|nr:hypothetical protein [Candidatus Saccharimonadales bacterium]